MDFKYLNAIRKLKKAKKNNKVTLILDTILRNNLNVNDPKVLEYLIYYIEKMSVLQIVFSNKTNLSVETILNNDYLLNSFADYFAKDINRSAGSVFYELPYSQRYFKELMESKTFYDRLKSKIDAQKLSEELISSMLEYGTYNHFENVKNMFAFLKEIGFHVDIEKYMPLLESNSSFQADMYSLGLIDEKVVDHLYENKFAALKEWYKTGKGEIPKVPISSLIIPSKTNKMANYWHKQSLALGQDAMELVFLEMKRCGIESPFIDEDFEINYQDWAKKRAWRGEDTKEDYLKTEILFTEDGLPKSNLFTKNKLLDRILYYNYEGHKGKYNPELIKFLINNIDSISFEYRFIFEKIKELGNIENPFTAQRLQEEFLSLATDSHRLEEKERIYDENGLNEKFYEAVLIDDISFESIKLIEPDYASHLNANEQTYIEKYKTRITPVDLYNFNRVYNKNYDDMITTRELINMFFSNGEPNEHLANALVCIMPDYRYKNILKEMPEIQAQLSGPFKGYYIFYTKTDCYDLPPEKDFIIKYFTESGPKKEFVKYLFANEKFEYIRATGLPYQEILSAIESLVVIEYEKIADTGLSKVFKEYVKKNIATLDENKIKLLAKVLETIINSNSTELSNLRESIARLVLETTEPLENLAKIERIFVKNNIPTVGKIYSVFDILHPNFQGFDLSDTSMISPTLKKQSNFSRHITIFSDLFKAAIGSNNRSIINYLKNLREADIIYQKLKNNPTKKLTAEEEKTMKEYISHLATMYLNTLSGKKKEELNLSNNYIEDIEAIKKLLSPDGSLDYNLSDRLVDMFCHFAGFTTLEQAEKYLHDIVEETDRKNRTKVSIDLEKGNFIKGIGRINYLAHILQNGSVSKEYLGAYASSDSTPLDTDLSMISKSGTPEEALKDTIAAGYGPIWLVLKQDNRFTFTRRGPLDSNQEIEEIINLSKLEIFYTGASGRDHYGIRTGFPSTAIDYIVVEQYDIRVGLEIALNGFYIPVFDKQGKRVFSPNDYDLIRSQMAGLTYYNAEEFKFSNDLIVPHIIEIAQELPASKEDIIKKRTIIYTAIKKALQEHNIDLKLGFDGDLSEGTAELIDTGSTGRFTNVPGDGDFDFMLKLDRRIIADETKLNAIKHSLLNAFNKSGTREIIGTGDFRLKKVQFPNLPMTVDIDITFEPKTDKVEYSTDEALKDRLQTISKQDREKGLLVIANILLAKKLLKRFAVYKPNRGENPEGGLGGVGIENWILQNGGSLKTAAESFLKASKGKSFEEFKKSYVIWDFGTNHLVTRKDIYPHDNFVYNMSEAGYEKMKKVLNEYLKSIESIKTQEVTIDEIVSNIKL